MAVIALIISAVALGWNIYRDAIRKPKLRVRMIMGTIVQAVTGHKDHRLVVNVTNFGPGKTRINSFHLRRSSLWLRLTRKREYGFLMYDFADPVSARLPSELEVGQKIGLTFRIVPDLFLGGTFTQLGVIDSFERTHWCSKRDYREAREQFLKQQKTDSAK
jgi:hypothetical protein